MSLFRLDFSFKCPFTYGHSNKQSLHILLFTHIVGKKIVSGSIKVKIPSQSQRYFFGTLQTTLDIFFKSS